MDREPIEKREAGRARIFSSRWTAGETAVTETHLRELGAAVGRMHRELRERVAREEGRAGFFAFLCQAAPRYLTFIETLHNEHRHLLSALVSLRAKIAHAKVTDWEALVAEADAIRAAVRDHEELERDLLQDALEEP